MPDTYQERVALYKEIEKSRNSRVVAFVTGDRPGMQTQISNDVVDLFSDHLGRVDKFDPVTSGCEA